MLKISVSGLVDLGVGRPLRGYLDRMTNGIGVVELSRRLVSYMTSGAARASSAS